VRGRWSDALRWMIAGYRTDLSNDILFVNTPGGLINGFFQNIGNTRRQGAELGLQGRWQRLAWYANFSFVNATYQSNAMLQNALGPVPIQPGDRIPAIPQQTVKLGAEYEVLSGWFIGGDLLYASSQFVRGDDNNQLPQVHEYLVVNLNSRYQVTKYVEVFALANNIFDQKYETFGVVNRNFFTGATERFLGPGAPISGWGGIRVRFD
jgi:Outer membrane cobalamin receptor protein